MNGAGALVLQLVSGVGGLLGIAAVINALLSRPKVRAEATQIATQTANETTTVLIGQLRAEMTRMSDDNTALRSRIDALETAENASDQKLRETRTALWECWSVLKRTHGYLTLEEKAEIGPLPDVERFFK